MSVRAVHVALTASVLVGCAASSPSSGSNTPAQTLEVGTSKPGTVLAVAPLARDAPLDGAGPPPGNGPRAPSFDLPSVTSPGARVTIPRGKVVVLHYWATWCMPCKHSFPQLQALYTAHKARGLEVVALSVDDEIAGIAEFAKSEGNVTFPVAWDDGHKIAEAMKVERMPTTYLIDRHGVIVHVHGGYSAEDAAKVEREIEALF